ncbi:MAG: hypothetical protein II590_01980 [Clostridia bacterium]|nr:hypothetical protein [Clostridia bacterium]
MFTILDAALPSIFDIVGGLLPYLLLGLLISAAVAGAIVLIVLFSKKRRK